MQCPNPDCENPELASSILNSGKKIENCPKCGESLGFHEDKSDVPEEQNNGSQDKEDEYLKVSHEESGPGI